MHGSVFRLPYEIDIDDGQNRIKHINECSEHPIASKTIICSKKFNWRLYSWFRTKYFQYVYKCDLRLRIKKCRLCFKSNVKKQPVFYLSYTKFPLTAPHCRTYIWGSVLHSRYVFRDMYYGPTSALLLTSSQIATVLTTAVVV